jgi:hypothetical protein
MPALGIGVIRESGFQSRYPSLGGRRGPGRLEDQQSQNNQEEKADQQPTFSSRFQFDLLRRASFY